MRNANWRCLEVHRQRQRGILPPFQKEKEVPERKQKMCPVRNDLRGHILQSGKGLPGESDFTETRKRPTGGTGNQQERNVPETAPHFEAWIG